MTILILPIALPLVAGLLAFLARPAGLRRLLLPSTAVTHFAITLYFLIEHPAASPGGWLDLDGTGQLFLLITSFLFMLSSFYAYGYLGRELHGKREDFVEGLIFTNSPEGIFIACMLFFLSSMTAVTLIQHFGLMWAAIEATTLASAPLIYFHRHRRSLEATWKYLLICSVGLALALMGYMFLVISSGTSTGEEIPPVVQSLVDSATLMQPEWLKVSFILFLVGYGTKTGLAPLHTWLPDAHSEAPSVVSALLSGALLNCAFIGILRAYEVCVSAGLGPFARDMLVVLGIFSMAVAAIFILGQSDFKRMLAYSSVEHMGIISLGVGLGGAATFGAMLHALNHSLAKGMLFLVAGNILASYKSKSSKDVNAVLRVIPASGILWIAGFLAITGAPPFGLFISEFAILKGALELGRYGVATAYIVLLAIIFIGMSAIVLRMSQGLPVHAGSDEPEKEPFSAIMPPAVLAMTLLVMGLYIPPQVKAIVYAAAERIGGL